MPACCVQYLPRFRACTAFWTFPLTLVLAGCSSLPQAQLTGGVYDGHAYGLGYTEFELSQLGNATTAPAAFRYNWDLPLTVWIPPAPPPPIQEASAVLARIATVWQFQDEMYMADPRQKFAVKAEADYFVFDDDSAFHRAVSKILHDAAQKFVADYHDNWADTLKGPDAEDTLLPQKPATEPDETFESRQSADLVCDTANIISVQVFPRSWPGNPESAILYNFYNDGGQARSFTEAELFLPHSGWEQKLSDLCMAQLRKDEATYVADGTVTRFTPEQLLRFTVKPTALKIYFYSMEVELGGGDSTVDIPWADLRNYLDPAGPARFLTDLAPPIAAK